MTSRWRRPLPPTGVPAVDAIEWRAVGPDVVTATFPASSSSVPLARAWVSVAMTGYGSREDSGTAALLVGELATNAVQHAATPEFTVRLDFTDGLEAAVHDQDGAARVEPGEDLWASAGRGLSLVAALADSWGTRSAGGGKWVWFRLMSWARRDGEPSHGGG